jgi:hypothetical protein
MHQHTPEFIDRYNALAVYGNFKNKLSRVDSIAPHLNKDEEFVEDEEDSGEREDDEHNEEKESLSGSTSSDDTHSMKKSNSLGQVTLTRMVLKRESLESYNRSLSMRKKRNQTLHRIKCIFFSVLLPSFLFFFFTFFLTFSLCLLFSFSVSLLSNFTSFSLFIIFFSLYLLIYLLTLIKLLR